MRYSKVKNGVKITVEKWDNKITLTNAKTGVVLGIQEFSDHIKAITLAKLL